MNALSEIGSLIIETFFYLMIIAVLLRLLLQAAKADFYNPISQGLVKATQPVLKPLRRVIPGFFGIDMAAVVLALALHIIASVLLILVAGYTSFPILNILAWAVIGCLYLITNLYFFGILIYIIISWVAPSSYNPAILLLRQLIEPIMQPFRRIIQPIGGIDLSPIFIFLTINIVQVILRNLAQATQLVPQFVIGM